MTHMMHRHPHRQNTHTHTIKWASPGKQDAHHHGEEIGEGHDGPGYLACKECDTGTSWLSNTVFWCYPRKKVTKYSPAASGNTASSLSQPPGYFETGPVSLGWPGTHFEDQAHTDQRSTCCCLSSTGIKGMWDWPQTLLFTGSLQLLQQKKSFKDTLSTQITITKTYNLEDGIRFRDLNYRLFCVLPCGCKDWTQVLCKNSKRSCSVISTDPKM